MRRTGSASTAATPGPTRARGGCPRARTGPRPCSTRPGSPGPTRGWPGVELADSVIYELHVGTFTAEGTLDAALARLDHLVDLGVTLVELLPLASFPGVNGWGYDGVAPYAVHEPYGGPEALQRFVDACHARGLGVCLDVVYNHLGPDGNYLGEFGPYFTDRYETPWGWALNLDGPHSDPVHAFVVDNALMWLRDFHVDALRLDAVHELYDEPRPAGARGPLAAGGRPRRRGRPAADADRRVRPQRPLARCRRADRAAPAAPGCTRSGPTTSTTACTRRSPASPRATTPTSPRPARWPRCSPPRSSTTAPGPPSAAAPTAVRSTRRTRPGGGSSASLQTHDQVGNRMTGERLSHLLSPGVLACGAALLLTSAYTPMLFMGEEWGASTPWQYFTDHTDPELARAVQEGRKNEFASHGWDRDDVPDPQAPETVEHSRLDWDEVHTGTHARLLDWYRSLIALRHLAPELHDGRLDAVEVQHDVESGVLVMTRGRYRTVVNLADAERSVPLDGADAAPYPVLLAWEPEGTTVRDGALTLPAASAAVLGPPATA